MRRVPSSSRFSKHSSRSDAAARGSVCQTKESFALSVSVQSFSFVHCCSTTGHSWPPSRRQQSTPSASARAAPLAGGFVRAGLMRARSGSPRLLMAATSVAGGGEAAAHASRAARMPPTCARRTSASFSPRPLAKAVAHEAAAAARGIQRPAAARMVARGPSCVSLAASASRAVTTPSASFSVPPFSASSGVASSARASAKEAFAASQGGRWAWWSRAAPPHREQRPIHTVCRGHPCN